MPLSMLNICGNDVLSLAYEESSIYLTDIKSWLVPSQRLFRIKIVLEAVSVHTIDCNQDDATDHIGI